MLNAWRNFIDWLLAWHTKRSCERLGRDIKTYEKLMRERPNHKGPIPWGYK